MSGERRVIVALVFFALFAFILAMLTIVVDKKITGYATLPPPSGSSGVVTNTMTITEKDGVSTNNYPVSFGRPYLQGEIMDYPEVLVDGTPVLTQADVKNRWPDGSVKFVIISFLIPTLLANGQVTITFQNQLSGNNIPLTDDEMLASNFDFDAKMELTQAGQTQSVSARDMLSDGYSEIWTSGPVANTVILADHSVNRAYDLGWKPTWDTIVTGSSNIPDTQTVIPVTSVAGIAVGNMAYLQDEIVQITAISASPPQVTVIRNTNGLALPTIPDYSPNTNYIHLTSVNWQTLTLPADANFRSFRPIFEATFWPTINKVKLRYIGENANTETLQNLVYDLSLKIGTTPAPPVYTKNNINHHPGSRWTKVFWIGGQPPTIQIDHNRDYIIKTNYVPNYDPNVVVSPTTITTEYNNWLTKPKDLFNAGSWLKSMGDGGSRPDLGERPLWDVLTLFTFDNRMVEWMLGNSDLSAAWPIHFREGDTTKLYNGIGSTSALGREVTTRARPTLCACQFNYGSTVATDKIIPVARMSDNGWRPGNDHQVQPVKTAYMLTGEHWYYEEQKFWSSFASVFHLNRGPPGNSGLYLGAGGALLGLSTTNNREEAWPFTTRVVTALYTVDGSAEKTLYTQLTNEAISAYEGYHGITTTSNFNNALWQFGDQFQTTPSSLGFWARGSTGYCANAAAGGVEATTGLGSGCDAPWMYAYLMLAFGRAKEMGFATDAVVNFFSNYWIGQFTTPGYNPFYLGSYRMPVSSNNGADYLTSWANVQSRFNYVATTFDHGVLNPLPYSPNGYAAYHLAATSFIYSINPIPYNTIYQHWQSTNSLSNLNTNPMWAFVPRNLATAVCSSGTTQSCYSGTPGTQNVGTCVGGTQTCSVQGQWGPCVGEVIPTPEICSDNLDNDCNGVVNNGCVPISPSGLSANLG